MSNNGELFNIPADWEEQWQGMPEFIQDDLTSEPKNGIRRYADKRYEGEAVGTRYPIYIVSKGRWKSRMTSKALERIRVPYRIVIEPQEFDQYASVIDPSKILVLPFGNLGKGSIPARNWIWEHSVSDGYRRHWILDDNIMAFFRLNRNYQRHVSSAAIFCAAEDFVDSFTNVAIAGFQYRGFVESIRKYPAFILNTRVYSCILLDNALRYRWRGTYNEDTDLCLRILKDGLCSVLFYAFTQRKAVTMTMNGGNTDELYHGDGRRKMAESLNEQHPDITKITRKWGRWQHHVDYNWFKRNKLIRRVELSGGINNYGMKLVETRR